MGKKEDIKPRKTDRRTIYTRNVIKDALLEAMKEKAFEQIKTAKNKMKTLCRF